MIWLVILTLTVIFSVGYGLPLVLNAPGHRHVERSTGLGSVFFSYVIFGLLLWGIVTNIGWTWATVGYAAWMAFGMGQAVYERERYEALIFSLRGILLSLVVYTVLLGGMYYQFAQ